MGGQFATLAKFMPPAPRSLPLAQDAGQPVSDDRPEMIERLGRPDSFSLLVLTIEGVEVRRETWRYDQFGAQVDFIDGAFARTLPLDPAPLGTLFPAWYDPLEFEPGMTSADAVRLAAISSPSGTQPAAIDLSAGGADLAAGQILVGDQILLGFDSGRLVYVETTALSPAGAP